MYIYFFTKTKLVRITDTIAFWILEVFERLGIYL